MSDLTNRLFYEVTLSDIKSGADIDKLLLKSQADVALLLKKMGVRKDIVENGFSCSMGFCHGDLSIDINRLEPHKLDFTHKAHSVDRGDSLFELFTPDVAIEVYYEFKKFIEYCNDNLEYCDSFRIGICDDEDSMLEFNELCTCCGEHYSTVNIDGFGDVIFGCNYGH